MCSGRAGVVIKEFSGKDRRGFFLSWAQVPIHTAPGREADSASLLFSELTAFISRTRDRSNVHSLVADGPYLRSIN
jgi:hypothetical protein